MKKEIKVVVLAAGKSKRMKSDVTKMVHKILGREIINFLLDSLVEAGIAQHNIIMVASEENILQLKKIIRRDVEYAIQKEQQGTADALLSAKEYIKDFSGDVLVTVGDNPYITAVELKNLIAHHQQTEAQCSFISAVFPHTPPPYGRILRGPNGAVTGIVEEVDANPQQKEIREVNASIYLMDNTVAYPLLLNIDNKNEKGEYYLTDIIQLLRENNHRIEAVKTDNYFISIGINNRWELQEAQQRFNDERLKHLSMETGVTILQPQSVTIEYGVKIGKDTVIYPSTYLAAGTRVGSNCRIGPFVYLENTHIADNKTIRHCQQVG
ncbi:MAG: NTP transferase domain-containing protein [bacterium]|nr:NTP transferase domain-containing protein [bacterium]